MTKILLTWRLILFILETSNQIFRQKLLTKMGCNISSRSAIFDMIDKIYEGINTIVHVCGNSNLCSSHVTYN